MSEEQDVDVDRKDRKSTGIRISPNDYKKLRDRTRLAGFIHIDDYLNYLMNLETRSSKIDAIVRRIEAAEKTILTGVDNLLSEYSG